MVAFLALVCGKHCSHLNGPVSREKAETWAIKPHPSPLVTYSLQPINVQSSPKTSPVAGDKVSTHLTLREAFHIQTTEALLEGKGKEAN